MNGSTRKYEDRICLLCSTKVVLMKKCCLYIYIYSLLNRLIFLFIIADKTFRFLERKIKCKSNLIWNFLSPRTYLHKNGHKIRTLNFNLLFFCWFFLSSLFSVFGLFFKNMINDFILRNISLRKLILKNLIVLCYYNYYH